MADQQMVHYIFPLIYFLSIFTRRILPFSSFVCTLPSPFFLNFGLSNPLSLPLSSHSRHWWIWWMSQSLVPLLTPGARGPWRPLEQPLEQPLRQKTPGILMVYTNAAYTQYSQDKLDDTYLCVYVCVCVRVRGLCSPPAAHRTVTLCWIGMLLHWLSSITAQGEEKGRGEDVGGRYHEGKECGGGEEAMGSRICKCWRRTDEQ